MIESKDMTDFIDKGNLDDIRKIIYTKFPNYLQKHDMDELINHFVVSCLHSKSIERFDPSYEVKFSTYMYRVLSNCLIIFDRKIFLHADKFTSLDVPVNNFQGGVGSHMLHDIVPKDDEDDFDHPEKNVLRDNITSYLKESKIMLSKAHNLTAYEFYTYYLEGWTDKELSDKFNYTVAGIGAMKKRLLKHIRYGLKPSGQKQFSTFEIES